MEKGVRNSVLDCPQSGKVNKQTHNLLNLQLSILGAWALSAPLSSPRLLCHPSLLYTSARDGKQVKVCVPHEFLHNSATADALYFLALYLVPQGIITASYARIALYLRENERLWNEVRRDWSSAKVMSCGQPQVRNHGSHPKHNMAVTAMRKVTME